MVCMTAVEEQWPVHISFMNLGSIVIGEHFPSVMKNIFILQCYWRRFFFSLLCFFFFTDGNAKWRRKKKIAFEVFVPWHPEHMSCRKCHLAVAVKHSDHKLRSTCLRSLFSYPLLKADDGAKPSPTHCAADRNSMLQLLNLGSILCKLHPALLKVLAVTATTNCCLFSPRWKEI